MGAWLWLLLVAGFLIFALANSAEPAKTFAIMLMGTGATMAWNFLKEKLTAIDQRTEQIQTKLNEITDRLDIVERAAKYTAEMTRRMNRQ